MSQPKKKIVSFPIVKIQLPAESENRGAMIYSQDRSIDMPAALSVARKRLRPGETYGYFKSEMDEDGILEIGDRLEKEPAVLW